MPEWPVPYPPSPYDRAAFRGTAPYYRSGRPPYSLTLRDTIASELHLDGTGRLLDVGCGPGTVSLELAPLFSEVIGLDPEPGMLEEARRSAEAAGLGHVQWIEGVAEEIDRLGVAPCRLVTFGQSFHRTDQRRVADLVYDVLGPGGSVALIGHTVEGRPKPPDAGYPEIPHDEINALIERYLGPNTWTGGERWEVTLRASHFGSARTVFAPGRPDFVRDIDSVVANFFSMSWAAPRHFGTQLGRFEDELRTLLWARSPEGLFWDWPGDTEIVLATKPTSS